MSLTLQWQDALYQVRNDFKVTIKSFSLKPFELCVLIGRNGCGKSTLARALAGRFTLLEGLAPQNLTCSLVSFEDQQQLFEDDFNFRNTDTASAKEELGFCVSDLIENTAVTEQVIQALRLENLLSRPIRTLSGGEGRKVLIAKALCQNPDLLILDAPFDALDVKSREALLEIIAFIHENFKTPVVLMVNRQDEIPSCTTTLGLIEKLEIKKYGAFDEMREDPDLKQILDLKDEKIKELPQAPVKFRVKDLANEVLVDLKNINITYDRVIFKNFNFKVKKGDHYLITGPNGAGKSTLLSLITGDNPLVYANDVTVFGMKRGSGESIWDIKQYLGFVSSALHLDYRVSASVIKVILSGFFDSIGLYQVPGDEELKIAHEWLSLIGLENEATKSFKELSFGQQRLVLIVRALVKNPPLLILDEPLQGLDAKARSQVKSFISYIMQNSNTAVLFVSHHEEDFPEGINHTLTFVKDGKGGFNVVEKKL